MKSKGLGFFWLILAILSTEGCVSPQRWFIPYERQGLEVELKVDPKKCYMEKENSPEESTGEFVQHALEPVYFPTWTLGAYVQSTSDGVTETVCRVTFSGNWSQGCTCRQSPARKVKSPW